MLTQYIYDKDGFLIGTYVGAEQQPNSTTIPPVYVEGFIPQFVGGTWVDQAASPTVSPVQFKLLFTPQERVAVKESRNADLMIDDFFDIVEDPRLTFVDLGLQSTKDAIAYLVSKNLLTEARAAEVLSGVLK